MPEATLTELPAEWWKLSDDELRGCEIGPQPECADCGGKCCGPVTAVEVAIDTSFLNARKRIREQGYPCDVVRGFRDLEGGRHLVMFECLGYGAPCEVDPKPEGCRKFPVPWLRSDVPEDGKRRMREICAVLRRLEGGTAH